MRHAALRVAPVVALATFTFAQQGLAPTPGGRLVIAQRSEPRGLNPVLAVDEPSRTVLSLLHAPLVRIHPSTQSTEGILAESWQVSRDGREILVRLRPGLRFSDGSPLTVEDVLFTFRVHMDASVASPQQELLKIGGQPVVVQRGGPREVRFRIAEPYALGERILAGIAILPRRQLESAWQSGKFGSTWTLNTPPREIAGAGPFQLKSVQPGQRIVLERNPYYWAKDAAGRSLPYLQEIEFVSTAGEDAQTARLLSGEADLISGFGGSSFRAIEKLDTRSGVQVADAGPSLDYTFLLFNLNPGAGDATARTWFENSAFRRAVSLAVDRAAIVRLVYRGRASSIWHPVSPARKRWFDDSIPRPAQSLDAARQQLRGAGFRWDNGGRLLDSSGKRVSFTILANAANPAYLQTGAIIEEDLGKLGIEARLVPLEFRSLIDRVTAKRDYDVAILALRPGDTDPSADMNAFVSQGRTRLWNLSGKAERLWEAEIDRLMRDQMTTRDGARRRETFNRVQRILAEQVPLVCLVSPNLLYAHRANLRNLQPGVIGDPVLWNADRLYWEGSKGKAASSGSGGR
jgi:peptide/nickel transport system substrate-binding protein